jgi:hypothetical protein
MDTQVVTILMWTVLDLWMFFWTLGVIWMFQPEFFCLFLGLGSPTNCWTCWKKTIYGDEKLGFTLWLFNVAIENHHF